MANEMNNREGSLLRLQTAEGVVVGAGFFYSPRQAICCASSVSAVLGHPGLPPAQVPENAVPVYMEGRPVQFAKITAWFTLQGAAGIDFAVLEFSTDILPAGGSARLGILDLPPGTVVEALGFMPGVGSPITAVGTVVAEVSNTAVQVVDSSADGRLTMAGYNGAPVWDALSGAVIAMLTVREEPGGNLSAFLVPVEALARTYGGLPVRLPDDSPGPLFDVPDLPVHYYDRPDEYNRLRAAVLSGRVLPKQSRGTTSVTIPSSRTDTGPTETLRSERIVLQGMPGIGKSVMAAALARDRLVRRLFPDGVIWVHVGPTPDLPLLQARLAVALGEDYAAYPDASQGRRSLRSLLYARSCLIILDDVWDRAHARAFDCLGRNGLLLLTARDVGLAGELRAYRIPLSQMKASEGAELLRRWAGAPVDTPSELLIQAAAACSYIPVVLKLFGPLLPQNPDFWTAEIVRLNMVDYTGLATKLPTYAFPILLRVIRVAWGSLPVNLQNRLLDLAVFPFSTSIPVEAVATYWNPLGLGRFETLEILEELASRALIDAKRDMAGDITSISIHGLPANYLRCIFGDVPALHKRLVLAYGQLPPEDDGYILQHLVYHLRTAGMLETLRTVLFDFGFLHRRLETGGVDALLSDYRACLTSSPLSGLGCADDALAEQDGYQPKLSAWEGGPVSAGLALVEEAVRRSAPHLAQRSDSLAGQLLGRLELSLEDNLEIIRKAVSEAQKDTRSRPEVLTVSFIAETIERLRIFIDEVTYKSTAKASEVAQRRVVSQFSMPGSLNALALASLEVQASPDMRRLLAGARAWRGAPWLRPLQAGLTLPEVAPQARLRSPAQPTVVKITMNGRRAVSGAEDGRISLWDLDYSGREERLVAHEGAVTALAFTPDGQRFLSGGQDGRILIWSLLDGEWLGSLTGHAGRVLSIAVSPDNRRVITGSSTGGAFIFDLETLQLLRKVDLEGQIRALIILPGSLQAVSAGLDIRVWDLETGFIIFRLTEHQSPVTALSLSSNGQWLASASEDATARLWDISSGRMLRTMYHPGSPVTAVEFRPATSFLVSGTAEGHLFTWDVSTGRIVSVRDTAALRILSLSVAMDGRSCITAHSSSQLCLWDLQDRRHLHMLQGHNKAVQAVKLFADGRRAVSGARDGSVRVWDAASGEQIARFDLPGQDFGAVAVTPDGQNILGGLESGQLAIWSVRGGNNQVNPSPLLYAAHDGPILAMAVSPDGSRAVTASADATLKVWSLDRNADGLFEELVLVNILRGHTSWVRGVQFFPDGWRVVSVSADRTIKLWNVVSGVMIYSINGGHSGEINDVAVVGGLSRFVTAGDDHALRVWDAVAGRPLYVLSGHVDEVTGVDASSDGRRIVSVAQDRTLRIWTLPRSRRKPPSTQPNLTGTVIKESMALSGHSDWINRVVVTPDGTRALTASSDHHLSEWDVSADGAVSLQNLPAPTPRHDGSLDALVFTEDGRKVASGGEDGQLMIWSLDHDRQGAWRSRGRTARISGIAGVRCISFLGGDKFVAGAGGDGVIQIWDPHDPKKPGRKLTGHEGAVTNLAVLKDSWRLASAGEDGAIGIWDPASGQALTWLQESTSPVRAMQLLGDGKRLLSLAADGMMRIWDFNAGRVISHAQLTTPDQQPLVLEVAKLQANGLVAGGVRPGRGDLMTWTIHFDRFIRSDLEPALIPMEAMLTRPRPIRAMAFMPNSPWILAASGTALIAWNVLEPEAMPLFEGESDFLSLAIHPRGELVAAGDHAGHCHIMALETELS